MSSSIFSQTYLNYLLYGVLVNKINSIQLYIIYFIQYLQRELNIDYSYVHVIHKYKIRLQIHSIFYFFHASLVIKLLFELSFGLINTQI